MEKIITVRIPEGLEKEIEKVVKSGLFKDKSEFVRFSILKMLLEIDKIRFEKEQFLQALNNISKSFDDLSEEEKEKLINDAINWTRKQ